MGDAWTAFARGGDPGWPAYEPGTRATMWLEAVRSEVVPDPMGVERTWWDGLDAGLGFDVAAALR
jgi:para-nitrobenzyl esterase